MNTQTHDSSPDTGQTLLSKFAAGMAWTLTLAMVAWILVLATSNASADPVASDGPVPTFHIAGPGERGAWLHIPATMADDLSRRLERRFTELLEARVGNAPADAATAQPAGQLASDGPVPIFHIAGPGERGAWLHIPATMADDLSRRLERRFTELLEARAGAEPVARAGTALELHIAAVGERNAWARSLPEIGNDVSRGRKRHGAEPLEIH